MSEEANVTEQPIVDDSYQDDSQPIDPSDQPVEGSSDEAPVKSETVEELKEEVEQAIEEGASEEEVKSMIEEFELKVNGKTKKVKVDLNDKEDLKKRLQLAEAGRGAMQEAAELKKLYQQEIGRLKENPWEVLKELELDPDQLAEERIRQKIEEMEKSPEQREKEIMQKELEDARRELERQKQEAEQVKFQQMLNEQHTKIEQDIETALSKHETLPKSRKTVARIADAMLWAIDNGFPDATVDDVIPTVEAEIKRELEQFFSEMPEESLESYFGKKNLDRLRKKRLQGAKPNNINNIRQTAKPQEKEDNEPRKKMRAKDYFRNL